MKQRLKALWVLTMITLISSIAFAQSIDTSKVSEDYKYSVPVRFIPLPKEWTDQTYNSIKYVTFKLPDTFPTRVIVPANKIVFDVYTTDQTNTNYNLFRLKDSLDNEIKFLEKKNELQREGFMEYMENVRLQGVECEKQIDQYNSLVKNKEAEIIKLEKMYILKNDEFANCAIEYKKATHRNFFQKIGRLGYGIFRLDYIAAGFAGYFIAKSL